MADLRTKMQARKGRVRTRLKRNNAKAGRARLSIHRSGRHMYAQVIDDAEGHTLAAASTVEKSLSSLKTGADTTAAAEVGKLIAERAVGAGISEVAFDRSGYRYHGRVKALADAAREAGLQF